MKLFVLALAGALLAPAAALGSSGSVIATGSCDRYMSCNYLMEVQTGEEADDLRLSTTSDHRVLVELVGGRLTARGRCRAEGDHAVSCSDATQLVVRTAGGADAVDGSGLAGFSAEIVSGAGDDRLIGSPHSDRLQPGPGSDVIDGGEGRDFVTLRDESGPARIDLRDGTFQQGAVTERFASVESVEGSAGADVILGTDGFDMLFGAAGADRLEGGAGDDHLRGGRGDDVVLGGPGDDHITSLDLNDARDRSADRADCGPGADVLTGAEFPTVVHDSCEQIWGDHFGNEYLLRTGAAPRLSIPRDIAGPPYRFLATLRIAGAQRVERRWLHRTKGDGGLLRGDFKLTLASERINARRRRAPVLVEVAIDVLIRDGLGPGRPIRNRERLQIRLAALPVS